MGLFNRKAKWDGTATESLDGPADRRSRFQAIRDKVARRKPQAVRHVRTPKPQSRGIPAGVSQWRVRVAEGDVDLWTGMPLSKRMAKVAVYGSPAQWRGLFGDHRSRRHGRPRGR